MAVRSTESYRRSLDSLSDAIKNSKVDIVPKTVVQMGGETGSGGSSGGNGTVMDTLLKFITLDKLGGFSAT